MSLKWHRHRNPYVHQPFSLLRLSPFASINQITVAARGVQTQARNEGTIELAAQAFDEFEVTEASNTLKKPRGRAEALLLVHRVKPLDQKLTNKIAAEITSVARSVPSENIRLKTPEHVLWFLPMPGEELIEKPHWDDLGVGSAGDSADLAKDIVWDD